MLGLLQIVLSIVLTVIFGINNAITFTFYDMSRLALYFLISNIIITAVFLLLFVIFVYTTEKIDYRKHWKHKIANLISMYGFRFYNRVRLVTTGQENLPQDRNFVVFSNHIEYTDPLFIMQVYKKFPLAFIGKEPLFKIIGLKNLLRGLGNLPLSKYANRSALETILKAIKQVKGGMPMGVFPEAKRTYSNDLIEFKPGAFKLAQKAKADISPVCLYDMHKLSNKWRILPTKVYFKILPIIKYEDYKDLDSIALSKKVYKIINDQMENFKKEKE